VSEQEPPVKPGYKTTEFWLSVVTTVAGLLAASGLIAEDTALGRLVGLALVAAGSGPYAISRGGAKKSKQAGRGHVAVIAGASLAMAALLTGAAGVRQAFLGDLAREVDQVASVRAQATPDGFPVVVALAALSVGAAVALALAGRAASVWDAPRRPLEDGSPAYWRARMGSLGRRR